MDASGKLHLACFAFPQYTVNYGVQQGERWQLTVVDRGNALATDSAAMAFDRNSQLHVAFYDTAQVVHFLSGEAGGWQEQTVSISNAILTPPALQLLFDLANRPHIFYWNNAPNSVGPLVHAFRDDSGWTAESVPLNHQMIANHTAYSR